MRPANQHIEVRLNSIHLGGHRRVCSEVKATAKSNRGIVEPSLFRLGRHFGEAQEPEVSTRMKRIDIESPWDNGGEECLPGQADQTRRPPSIRKLGLNSF